jgi:hypothetical protein
MATVKITDPNGRVIELSEVTFAEAQAFANGTSVNAATPAPKTRRGRGRVVPMPESGATPNYAGFFQHLSDKGKKFIEVLRENRNGVGADQLTEKMGLTSPNQIGGITGGGMSKLAKRYHVDLATIYTADIRFDDGGRHTTYKPGSALFIAHTKPA